MKEILLEMYLERIKSEPPPRMTGFLGHLTAVLTHDVPDNRLVKLKDAGFPIAVFTGTKDHLVHYLNSYHLRDVLQPHEFIVWEGAGHGLPMEKFDEFNQALIRNFHRGLQQLPQQPEKPQEPQKQTTAKESVSDSTTAKESVSDSTTATVTSTGPETAATTTTQIVTTERVTATEPATTTKAEQIVTESVTTSS